MPSLPAFYVDNVRLLYTDTTYVRGNTISDCYGKNVVGINVRNCDTVRAKNNKILRMRTRSPSVGMQIQNCSNVLLVYNVASRCDQGFVFNNITTLDVYNITTHNCTIHVWSNSSGTFRNVAMSAYSDWKNYRNCTGFFASGVITVDIDYMMHTGLSSAFVGGTFDEGSNIDEEEILYVDEANDDLTPDHISELVNSGTDNPLRTEDPCIGGIESRITDEETADRKYQYNLLDNSFWDVENQHSVEMSLIKAFQSRILANNELVEKQTERDFYIKTADSTLKFSELYPIYSRMANASKTRKRVMDMWYAGQNIGTLTALNNAIGGYNLYPSFFKRMEDVEDCWIINYSYVDIDNWLLGGYDQKYGIVIDVLGLSTLTQSASAECYNNVQNCVADIAPTYWLLHHEAQPAAYLLLTDLYNGYENCQLSNMTYNDDFAIWIDQIQQDGRIDTPLISTETVASSGGEIEISVLDRVYSENITRRIYYRQGNSSTAMGSWTEIEHPIGEHFTRTGLYIQFRITVINVLRQGDYEFIGLCLRPYSTARIWTQPQS